MSLSSGEASLVLLVYQMIVTLLGYMKYFIESSKFEYKRNMNRIEHLEGKGKRTLHELYELVEIIGAYWIMGCLPTICFLAYIFHD